MNKTTLLAKLNREIRPYVTTNNYFKSLGESLCGISSVLSNNNIEPAEDLLICGFNNNEGRKVFSIILDLPIALIGKPISIYLTFVWYRMPSGNYEITAYFS